MLNWKLPLSWQWNKPTLRGRCGISYVTQHTADNGTRCYFVCPSVVRLHFYAYRKWSKISKSSLHHVINTLNFVVVNVRSSPQINSWDIDTPPKAKKSPIIRARPISETVHVWHVCVMGSICVLWIGTETRGDFVNDLESWFCDVISPKVVGFHLLEPTASNWLVLTIM